MNTRTEYMLEIYLPQSTDDVWVYFTSASPFMQFCIGDIVNPHVWEGSQSPLKVLQVVGVEHLVWETDSTLKHKVMVFTKEVNGTPALRLGEQATARRRPKR